MGVGVGLLAGVGLLVVAGAGAGALLEVAGAAEVVAVVPASGGEERSRRRAFSLSRALTL